MNIELECEQLLNQQKRYVSAMKCDWSKAPKWANYIAMDLDGTYHWFDMKPTSFAGYWSLPNARKERVNISYSKTLLCRQTEDKSIEGYSSIINSIVDVIRKNFPNTNVEHEILECEEDVVFINVDRKTYYTNEYSIFIMELQTEILWKNNYNNIYFGEIDEY